MKINVIDFFLTAIEEERIILSTVSGVASTKPHLIRYFNDDVDSIDIITTKSFQLQPNAGNREPIICEPEIGTFGNSVGLRNPGLEVALKELKTLRNTCNIKKILNVSLSASSPQDFITLIENFSEVADMVELNFSCPHAAQGYGASIGSNRDIARNYVLTIKKNLHCSCPLFIKLTPNVKDIGSIAKACIDAGADGITAINTVGPEQYIEAHSQQPILNNSLQGRGGKSGKQILPLAIQAIQEIRKAIGKNIPILGMGGISTGQDAFQLLQAGATAIGVGSALARVNQEQWPDYLASLKNETKSLMFPNKKNGNQLQKTVSFLSHEKKMEYKPHKVTKCNYLENNTVVELTLEGSLTYSAGEFVFLWLPGIGEKPFSPALSHPLTFLVKRRGKCTDALFNCKVGDTVYIRGPYGKPVLLPQLKKAFLIAGGTGLAVLPQIAADLQKQGTRIFTFVGKSSSSTSAGEISSVEEVLKDLTSYCAVSDDGIQGRVLQHLEQAIKTEKNITENEVAFFIVGPTPFFLAASKLLEGYGIVDTHIFISLEKETRCGVGLCGECACGKKLTCQHGTFFSYKEYKEYEFL